MGKIYLSDFTHDINVCPSQIIQLISDLRDETTKTDFIITYDEANIILEKLTQSYQVDNFDSFFLSKKDQICSDSISPNKIHNKNSDMVIDNNTIKEICDVVTAKVIDHVQKNLSAMKSELLLEVVTQVTKLLNAQYAPIVNELDERIKKLETEICYIDKENQSQDY